MTNYESPSHSVTDADMASLIGCACRANGLLHLLSFAIAKADEGPLMEPSPEAAEGISWLARQIGEDLKDAVAAAFDRPPVTLQTPLQGA
jgi:hypothetical protein